MPRPARSRHTRQKDQPGRPAAAQPAPASLSRTSTSPPRPARRDNPGPVPRDSQHPATITPPGTTTPATPPPATTPPHPPQTSHLKFLALGPPPGTARCSWSIAEASSCSSAAGSPYNEVANSLRLAYPVTESHQVSDCACGVVDPDKFARRGLDLRQAQLEGGGFEPEGGRWREGDRRSTARPGHRDLGC